MKLTKKETKALEAIAQNAIEACCVGKEPKELHSDNYSWFDRKDISERTGFSKSVASGLMSSLEKKNLIIDHEMDGTGWALTTEGIDESQRIWDEKVKS